MTLCTVCVDACWQFIAKRHILSTQNSRLVRNKKNVLFLYCLSVSSDYIGGVVLALLPLSCRSAMAAFSTISDGT
jgi:hypothetical protein